MKRTELQRRTPLHRSASSFTQRAKSLQRARALRQISKKRKADQKTYALLRDEFLIRYDRCVPCIDERTLRAATEVHHARGRVGKDYLDTTTWLPVCHTCHERITTEPTWAYERGYSLRRNAEASA